MGQPRPGGLITERTVLRALHALLLCTLTHCCEESYPAQGYRKLTRAQLDQAKQFTLVAALLSLSGSVFIIFSYMYFKSLRTFTFKLVVILSCTDLLCSLHYVLGMLHDTVSEWQHHECPTLMCYFTAAAHQYSKIASFFWTACISYSIYATLDSRDAEAEEPRFHRLSWGAAAACLLGVVATGSLGHGGNWCWIRQDRPLQRMTFYFIPLVLVMVYNGKMYARIGELLRETQFVSSQRVVTKLRRYIGVFLFINIFGVLHRLQNMVSPEHPSYFLFALQSFFDPLQGFGNAVVYGLNRKLINKYAEVLELRCPRLASMLGVGHKKAEGDPEVRQQLKESEMTAMLGDAGNGPSGGELAPSAAEPADGANKEVLDVPV